MKIFKIWVEGGQWVYNIKLYVNFPKVWGPKSILPPLYIRMRHLQRGLSSHLLWTCLSIYIQGLYTPNRLPFTPYSWIWIKLQLQLHNNVQSIRVSCQLVNDENPVIVFIIEDDWENIGAFKRSSLLTSLEISFWIPTRSCTVFPKACNITIFWLPLIVLHTWTVWQLSFSASHLATSLSSWFSVLFVFFMRFFMLVLEGQSFLLGLCCA